MERLRKSFSSLSFGCLFCLDSAEAEAKAEDHHHHHLSTGGGGNAEVIRRFLLHYHLFLDDLSLVLSPLVFTFFGCGTDTTERERVRALMHPQKILKILLKKLKKMTNQWHECCADADADDDDAIE